MKRILFHGFFAILLSIIAGIEYSWGDTGRMLFNLVFALIAAYLCHEAIMDYIENREN